MSDPDDERTGNEPANRSEPAPETRPACLLCGAQGEQRYADLEDRHFSAPGLWRLIECPDCGFVWLDPRPREGDLDRLYADYYTHDGSDGAGEAVTAASLPERAIRRGIPAATLGYGDRVHAPMERGLGLVLSAFGPLRELAGRGAMGLAANLRGELLDVGCGDGSFLREMRGLGWGVSGVERDGAAARVAARALGAERIFPDLRNAAEARPQGHDVITLSHVIEHLLDPEATLRECLACLRPGGLLVIATPNWESRGHAHFGRSWLHLDPPRHVQLYRSATLRRVVESAGFDVQRVETPSSSAHFVSQASEEIGKRGRLPGIRLPDASPARLLRGLRFWMREYALTRKGECCGEELLLFAKRPDEDAC